MDIPCNSDKDKTKAVYDKDFVRTDTNEQKITKFFGAPAALNTSVEIGHISDVSMSEEERKPTEETMIRNDKFEDKLMETTVLEKEAESHDAPFKLSGPSNLSRSVR